MPRLWPLAAIVVLLAACAASPIESAHFGPPADVERAIKLYYERNASEGGRCFNPYIDGFTAVTVREDTPDRLVVDARYFYRDRFQDGAGGQVCTGFNQRAFTLARDQNGRPVVVGMSGERYEPAIRSLIRRMLPN